MILIEKIETLSPSTLNGCLELLNTYFIPYDFPINDAINDQEIIWCKVKNEHLKKDAKFSNMYTLDKENRTILMEVLIKRRGVLLNLANEKKEILTENTLNGTIPIDFLDMLRPMNGSTAATFQYIRDQTEKANIEFNIFLPVAQLENGKNPYGLNGCIAAVIDYYYQRNFFIKEYSLEQIFKAYAVFSGNSIGKLKPFLSTFRQDKNYVKYFSKLQTLKINKLP